MKRSTLAFLYSMGILPIVLALCIQPPQEILLGFYRILTSTDVLLTDYIAVGGLAATLFNVGCLTLMSVVLIQLSHAEINGTAIASVFLMGSFAFFGKNVINVLPILVGTFLYAVVTKEPYQNIVHTSLLSTSFAPIITEMITFDSIPYSLRVIVAIAVGISAGFLIKPVAKQLRKAHDGFNLYNTGFAVGIFASVYVSLMKSYGYVPKQQSVLDTGHNQLYGIALSVLFAGFLITAFIKDRHVMKTYWQLLKESGYNSNDFLEKYGFPALMMNMAINGFMALGYVVTIAKGDLNGPIIGGILTVVGFSGLGKHPRNIFPIFLGVYLGGLTKNWSIDQPSLLLAALFGTALAPIAGHYGFIWGVFASYLNSSVALNSGQLHAGINLYNTGFSSGIVAAVLVPILNKFLKNKRPKCALEESDEILAD